MTSVSNIKLNIISLPWLICYSGMVEAHTATVVSVV